MEKRIFTAGCSVRAAGSGKDLALVGYAAKFGVLSNPISNNGGSFREKIAPGAFTRALAEKQDVLATIQHDPSRVLGRTKSGTLQLNQDATGLAFRAALDSNQQAHRDLHSACARGDFDSCSFAFSVPDGGDSWDNGTDEDGQRCAIRTLRNVDLHDIAIVQHPAYPQTEVNARSLAHYAVATIAAEDAELRAKARAYADQIRQDYIRDPSCKAVVLRNGIFHRDFGREAELKSLDLFFEAGPDAVIRELNRRAGVGFEAGPMRYDGGQAADPTQSLRDDDDDFDPSDADNEDEHERARDYHRACARKAKTLDAGVAHFKAADAHDLAARSGDANDSSRARAASRLLLKAEDVS